MRRNLAMACIILALSACGPASAPTTDYDAEQRAAQHSATASPEPMAPTESRMQVASETHTPGPMATSTLRPTFAPTLTQAPTQLASASPSPESTDRQVPTPAPTDSPVPVATPTSHISPTPQPTRTSRPTPTGFCDPSLATLALLIVRPNCQVVAVWKPATVAGEIAQETIEVFRLDGSFVGYARFGRRHCREFLCGLLFYLDALPSGDYYIKITWYDAVHGPVANVPTVLDADNGFEISKTEGLCERK